MRISEEELAQVKGTRVIAYVRESSVRNEHKISLDIQEMAIKETAGSLDLAIVRWVRDSDKTGRNFERDIQLAIQACLRGEADHIIVYNLSRFGRDYWGCIDYARSLRADGHLLISTDRREGVIDIDSSDGRDKAHDAFSYAADQSDKIGEGWSNAIKLNYSRGLAHRNTERWGYMWCKNAACKERKQCKDCREKKSEKFCKKCPPRPKCDDCAGKPQIPDPVTAPVVVETFDRIIAGVPVNTVARELNARGFRTPIAKKIWTSSSLHVVLDTGFHAGYMRRPNTTGEGSSKYIGGAVLIRTSAYTRGAHEPIISEEKWQAYVKLRTSVPESKPDTGKARYAESGLLFCAECGKRMNAARRPNGTVRWICSGGKVENCRNTNGHGPVVSAKVYEFLRTHVERPEILDIVQKSLRDHLAAINAQPVEDLESFERQEVALVAERRALVSNFNKGHIDEEDYLSEKERLDAEIKATKHQLSLLMPRDLPTFPPASFLAETLASWPELPFESQRTVLKSLIWRIEVSRGEMLADDRYKIVPLWEAYLTGDIKNKHRGRVFQNR